MKRKIVKRILREKKNNNNLRFEIQSELFNFRSQPLQNNFTMAIALDLKLLVPILILLSNYPSWFTSAYNICNTLLVQVRLKRYLEMRGADAGPLTMLCALPAFWVVVSLFY